MFKLQSLLLSIAIAFLLARKTITAITLNKRLFLFVGLTVGLLGYYFVFRDLRRYLDYDPIGLRAIQVAHLNIQDFYVVLFLGATVLLFSGKFSFFNLSLFLVTGGFCVPIAIGLSSRMIPFTLGVTFLYLAIAFQPTLFNREKKLRNIVIVALLVLAGAVYARSFIRGEARMMQVYDRGAVGLFRENPRYVSFHEAWKNFRQSPAYGIGFGKFIFPGERIDPADRLSGYWPHNLFLELLSELGLIGFFLFILFFYFVARKVFTARLTKDRGWFAFPCLIFVYIFTTMQLTHQITYPLLWLSIFMCSVVDPDQLKPAR